ncbi:starch synthase [Bordetella genomosp. 10]|uniref:Glycogen synthase n=2 Tax=Bordetella genomosp. 10 TaxID=1416804 RepID=A0A261SBQ1_9BORD|nr:glycogen synthase GlgA [Bordetella genomosp. 10]OZI34392.1 starch synthase [Bordetella genomosp. 10]
MKILAVTSEAFPLAKTGGLGDAVSGMARALHAAPGASIQILMPAYRGVLAQLPNAREIARFTALPGGPARLWRAPCAALGGVPVLLLQNDALYDRDHLYVDRDGREYADNPLRFGALAHAATLIAAGRAGVDRPDIVHAHDWHAGLVPLLLRDAGLHDVKSVLTIHNMAFQGLYDMEWAASLGVPDKYLTWDGAEFWGKLSFMKAGLRYADRITTVSYTYAREILTERFGCGLQGLLASRQHELLAVPNGIDAREWDPATDPHLGVYRYHAGDMANKAHNKRELQRRFGLTLDADAPLLVMGSRLTHQKMADVALQAVQRALDHHPELQVAVLGQGERPLEQEFQRLPHRYPGRCGVRVGFDEDAAHRLHAGGDMLLHGSRFEPFGLTPLYAMRYGTIPIGSRVGGMADTIVDLGAGSGRDAMRAATGILFDGETVDAMAAAITRALGLYRRPEIWRAMQHKAMAADFSWERAAPLYMTLYRSIQPDRVAAESLAPAEVTAVGRPSLLDQVSAAARPLKALTVAQPAPLAAGAGD